MVSLPFWFKVILVVVPFVWLCVGILATRLKTSTVAFTALVITTLLAWIGWGAPLGLVGISYLEGAVMAVVPILWVIVAAVFSYIVSTRTGAMKSLQGFLTQLSPEPAIQAILIAFGFGGFLESVAGFGTAVAIPTAMLVGMGFPPIRAALIALVANSVPVAFGALGIPVIVLSRITDLPVDQLSHAIVMQLLPFSLLVPMAIVAIANGGFKASKKVWIEAFLFGAVFAVLQTVIGVFIGPELVAVIASLGVMATALLFRFSAVKNNLSSVGQSMAPYGILLLLVLATRLVPIPWLKQFPFVLSWESGEHGFSVEWLTTPGTLLFLSCLIGSMIQKTPIKILIQAFLEVLSKLRSSTITIVSIVIMAKIMGNTPMIRDLSTAIAQVSGGFFPFLSPLLGALGTFITGSDTSSNILFGKLQSDTATALAIDPVWISAANTSGATAGKMISPQSITVVVSTVNLHGQEANILRLSLRFCLAYVALMGILVGSMAFLRWSK